MSTRQVAKELRDIALYQRKPLPDSREIAVIVADTIDALLDAIEAGGMVQVRQAPQMDLGPLRVLRAWHNAAAKMETGTARELHCAVVANLNVYFPEGDWL